MHDHGTLRECFRHNDWARVKLLAAATPLTAAQLDQPFEMGLGSLRATLYHLWAAEFAWLNRWQRQPNAEGWVADCGGEDLAEITRRFAQTAQVREAYLDSVGPGDIDRPITYTNTAGQTYTYPLGDLVLHVCNHGMHHRAQAVNLLKRLGVTPPQPGLDYVFMRMERTDEPPSPLGLGTIRAYFAYSDWAQTIVQTAAARLSDVQLDQPFDMGRGSLRGVLTHIWEAAHWWYENWTQETSSHYPEPEPGVTVAELTRRFGEVAAAREAFVARLVNTDLSRPVTIRPRAGRELTFPLGVTLLQLAGHGTHHRAQALNMLRQVGEAAPALDYVLYLRTRG